MSILNSIEKKFLFSLVRIVSLVSILILIIMLGVAGSKYLADPQIDTKVEYEELTLTPTHPTNGKGRPRIRPSTEAGVTIMEKYLGDKDNRKIVSGWIDTVPQEYRQDFVDNLATLMIKVEKNDPNNVITAANAYRMAKLKKINSILSPNPADSFKGTIVALFALAALGLIGMFCLILVFLAVERNTRKTES